MTTKNRLDLRAQVRLIPGSSEFPRETVRKVFGVRFRLQICWPTMAKKMLLRPISPVLGVELSARPRFSDSLRVGLLGNSESREGRGPLSLGLRSFFMPMLGTNAHKCPRAHRTNFLYTGSFGPRKVSFET